MLLSTKHMSLCCIVWNTSHKRVLSVILQNKLYRFLPVLFLHRYNVYKILRRVWTLLTALAKPPAKRWVRLPASVILLDILCGRVTKKNTKEMLMYLKAFYFSFWTVLQWKSDKRTKWLYNSLMKGRISMEISKRSIGWIYVMNE